ncbi:dihydropteroate synthase [Candidatus Peregrinibacteria bacterium CG10_big_fil_rev_8_21_14_0_10_36_19]|nr:MAG: dihydropteroate synthase [Candidatus Peregrinibacteria bacterium CG10_big_fil_rev_8_21_14_0_10_36_19]
MKPNLPLIMGILNITPDSFSDGGLYNSIKSAKKRAKEMEKEGVDIIDIGAESTGPGSKKVKEDEELKRIIPILKEIRKSTKLPISIDTYKAKVAEECLKEGANIINDISALRGDKRMAKVVSKYKCPIIIMYSKDKTPHATIKNKSYKNLPKTINDFLRQRIQYAEKNGIKRKNIIIDPGMGNYISSNPKYSYEILAKLSEFKIHKMPIMLGLSRKSFLGSEIKDRDEKALPLTTIAYLNGASIIRTHDIKGVKKLLKSLN